MQLCAPNGPAKGSGPHMCRHMPRPLRLLLVLINIPVIQCQQLLGFPFRLHLPPAVGLGFLAHILPVHTTSPPSPPSPSLPFSVSSDFPAFFWLGEAVFFISQ